MLSLTLITVYFLLGAAILLYSLRLRPRSIKDTLSDDWLIATTAFLFWLPIIIILLMTKIIKSIQRRYQRWQAWRTVLKKEAQEEKDAIKWAEADAEMAAYWKRKAITDERKKQQDILAKIPA